MRAISFAVLLLVLSFLLVRPALARAPGAYAEKKTIELMAAVSVAYLPVSSKTFNYNFAPVFNYFFAENWYLGGDLGLYYFYLTSGDSQNPDINFSGLGFSPAASLGYARAFSPRTYWFTDLGYGYAVCFGCQTSALGSSLVSSIGLKYDLGFGLATIGTNFIYNESLGSIMRLFLGVSVYF